MSPEPHSITTKQVYEASDYITLLAAWII
uniref:Uncharacterized protein n=1 Tax=Arundo donax TaxID=35708 RepID=A0A0A9EEC5_ARUDO